MSAAAAYLSIDVSTATLLRLDVDRFSDPHAVLKWMLPPELS